MGLSRLAGVQGVQGVQDLQGVAGLLSNTTTTYIDIPRYATIARLALENTPESKH